MMISLCTTCMGRTHHLRQTLPVNLADNVDWSRPDRVEFVVLDYSSRDGLAEWIRTDPDLQPYRAAGILKLARAPGHTHFRHSHAKNMAHAVATGEFVCNVDADNFTGAGFVDYLAAIFDRKPNAVIASNRLDSRLNSGAHKGCMGRVALSKTNFVALGGYDESDRFRGWSGEDSDLLIRAIRRRLRPVFIRDRRYLRVIEHTDLERLTTTRREEVDAELARIVTLDGSRARPILRYLLERAVAPTVANRGSSIGAGAAVLHD